VFVLGTGVLLISTDLFVHFHLFDDDLLASRAYVHTSTVIGAEVHRSHRDTASKVYVSKSPMKNPLTFMEDPVFHGKQLFLCNNDSTPVPVVLHVINYFTLNPTIILLFSPCLQLASAFIMLILHR
jgi:hypothetical protein